MKKGSRPESSVTPPVDPQSTFPPLDPSKDPSKAPMESSSDPPPPWDPKYHFEALSKRGNYNDDYEKDRMLNNIKTSIPEFEGLHDPDIYLDWERKVEKIFDCYDFTEVKKVQLACLEFRGYAATWWEMQQERRRRNRNPPIDTWEEMNGLMRGRFIPNQCPNRRVLFLNEQNGLESASEDEDEPQDAAPDSVNTLQVEIEDKEPELPHVSLVSIRSLNINREDEVQSQRENIFYTRVTIKDQTCAMIIDSGSMINAISQYAVDKLALTTTKHPKPYKLQWLTNRGSIRVTEDQERMQERFKQERVKTAAAAVRTAAVNGQHSAVTSPPTSSSNSANTAPLMPSNDSLVRGKASGSAPKVEQNRSLFISVKGVEKALKAGLPFVLLSYKDSATNGVSLPCDVQPLMEDFTDDPNSMMNSLQQRGNDEDIHSNEELNPELQFKVGSNKQVEAVNVMVDEIPFPKQVNITKPLSLLAHGITDIEIHFLQIKFTAIGVYLDPQIVGHLQKWKAKSAADLAEDDDFFDAVVSAPVEKLVRVVVIKEIKGSQYGVQLENAVRDRLAEEDKFEEEEEEALEQIVDFFQSKYFKKDSIITFYFPTAAPTVEIAFATEGKEESKISVKNANVAEMIEKWYLGGSRGVSPTTVSSLTAALSNELSK
ncbi:Chalcone-flavanone isomerase family protein [Perilla frutescens var. frutescens]|nr:Chalcone-flavanone isomerase family protein [Perilla frutescens var. frutescens]